EQVQRPAGASVRRLRASQHRQLRLALAVQLARLAVLLGAARPRAASRPSWTQRRRRSSLSSFTRYFFLPTISMACIPSVPGQPESLRE
ncbi:MAG: hypothetical protein OXC26_09050, partial [Albidovulum sp.]|nr:hypothetical protein [Albidovulum sp.]